jgi:hypothetical protein
VTTLKNGEQYAHFGNDMTHAGNDLMGGVNVYTGTVYEITDLDLAVLRDIGAPVKAPVEVLPADQVLLPRHDPAVTAIKVLDQPTDEVKLVATHDPAVFAAHHLFG